MNSSEPQSIPKEPRIKFVMGLPFHEMTNGSTLEECERILQSERKQLHHMMTANADFVAQAGESASLRKILCEADRVVCDGQPVVWASRLLGEALPERVAGSDLTPRLLEKSAASGYRVFILGPDPATAEKLWEELPKRFPGIQVVGIASPPFSPIDEWENERFVAEINEAKADLLLVCLGFPKQDLWISQFRDQLETVSLAVGVGASLDFIAGSQTRAPKWMQRTGLEWSWRMISDPRRMVKRYTHDFFSLIEESAAQWLFHHSRKDKCRPAMKLLNGFHLPTTCVVESLAQLDALLTIGPEQYESAVLDLSSASKSRKEEFLLVILFMRECYRNGLRPCVFNPKQSVADYLETLEIRKFLPCFREPCVVAAWAQRSTDNGASIYELELPMRVDHDATLAAIQADLEEIVRVHEFIGATKVTFRFSLIRWRSLSLLSALRIVFLRNQLAQSDSSELGFPIEVRVTGARPSVFSIFEMSGLEEDVEEMLTEEEFKHRLIRESGGVSERSNERGRDGIAATTPVETTDSDDLLVLPS